MRVMREGAGPGAVDLIEFQDRVATNVWYHSPAY
jgi:uncharacterized protein (DUF1330 family)